MLVPRIFQWIFRSPPPRPDQSVIPHFWGGGNREEEKKTGRRKIRKRGKIKAK